MIHRTLLMLALLFGGASASNAQEPVILGNWNGWLAACRMDPFDGPQCNVEKKSVFVPTASSSTSRLPTVARQRSARVQVRLDSSGRSLVFETQPSISDSIESVQGIYLPNRDYVLAVRVDLNAVVVLRRAAPTANNFALKSTHADPLIDEMRLGKWIYLRPQIELEDPITLDFDLNGFHDALASAETSFAKLWAEYRRLAK